MFVLKGIVFISCLLYCINQICNTAVASDNLSLINLHVVTTLDISSHIVQKTHEIGLKNYGNVSINKFLIAIEPNLQIKLSHIKVADESSNIFTVKPDTKTLFNVFLNQPLKSNEIKIFFVQIIYTNLLVPHPEVVRQHQPHLVQFSGNMLFYSPYFTIHHETNIIKGKGNTEGIEGNCKIILENNILECENFTNITPYSEHAIKIHYINSSPFLAITNFKRNIYISQWSSIQVTEEITIMHTGARFIGPFERSFTAANDSQISLFIAKLPYEAEDIYLSDEIGKIWTLEVVKKSNDFIALSMKPRFVLYGGWKISFVLSYTLPVESYIFSNESYCILKMNVIEIYFENMVIEEAYVNVILPEGAEFFNLELPYDMQIIEYDHKFWASLDIIGRKTIGFMKTNLVHDHSKPFSLNFHCSHLELFKYTALKIGFLTIFIYSLFNIIWYYNKLIVKI